MLGFGTLTKKVFGTPNDRKIKTVRPIVDSINALEAEFEVLPATMGLKERTSQLWLNEPLTVKLWTICYPKLLQTAVKRQNGRWACALMIRS